MNENEQKKNETNICTCTQQCCGNCGHCKYRGSKIGANILTQQKLRKSQLFGCGPVAYLQSVDELNLGPPKTNFQFVKISHSSNLNP